VTTAVVVAIASHYLLSPVDDLELKKSRSLNTNCSRNFDQQTKNSAGSNKIVSSLEDIELDLINKLISSLWPRYVKLCLKIGLLNLQYFIEGSLFEWSISSSVYRGVTERVVQPFCQQRFQDWAKAKNLDFLAELVTIYFEKRQFPSFFTT
jgi:hypothetical protein